MATPKFGADNQAERPRGWAEIVRESLAAPGVGPRNRSSERAFCGCSSPQNPLGRLHLEGDTRWVSEHRRCRGGGRWGVMEYGGRSDPGGVGVREVEAEQVGLAGLRAEPGQGQE